MFVRMVEHPDFGDYDLSSVRLLFTGGAVTPAELKEKIMKAFPRATLDDLMGLTEGGPLTTFLPHRGALRKTGSVGRAHFSQMVRVVNEKGGECRAMKWGRSSSKAPH